MNTFRTELFLKTLSHPIELKSKVLTIGSCFSTSIGQQLADNKFNCLVNPFGSIYNPISIHKLLLFALENKSPSENSYLTNEGLSKNYDFHSSFSSPSKTAVEEKMQSAISNAQFFLQSADYIIITYGTAFVYERKDTGEIVANCHKQPSEYFTRRLLSVDEIVSSFKNIVQSIKAKHPNIKFVLTVSPVRHIKDTLELNSVSKSILRIAAHQLKEQPNIDYFPAYELMMDDLRDYRFYEADMIHPNQQAIDYIWDKFSNQYFSDSTRNFIKQWKETKAALNHRPFNPEGEAHRKFLQQSITKLIELGKFVNTEVEIEQLKSSFTKPNYKS
jgi:hypothetical protein